MWQVVPLFPSHMDKTLGTLRRKGLSLQWPGCSIPLSSLEREACPSQLLITAVEIKGFLSERAVPLSQTTRRLLLAARDGVTGSVLCQPA